MDPARPTFHPQLTIEIPAEADLYEKLKASPFGPVNSFLSDTFRDNAHRLKLIGLELRA